VLNEDVWSFLTTNQVDEIFPFLVKKFSDACALSSSVAGSADRYYKSFITYVDTLPEENKVNLLYKIIGKIGL
jgi:hypothetical protein